MGMRTLSDLDCKTAGASTGFDWKKRVCLPEDWTTEMRTRPLAAVADGHFYSTVFQSQRHLSVTLS